MSYRLKYWGVDFVSKFKIFNPHDNFFIFCDPRGGSTWLAEIIHQIPSTAMVWEPLHLGYGNTFQKFGFQWRQFIPEETKWDEVRLAFDTLLRGRNWNIFSCQMTNPYEVLIAKRLIFKICRGNRILPWLTKQFDFKFKPIYMVRHPFAVVHSQLCQGGWDYQFETFKHQNAPFSELENQNADFLSSLETKEELLAAGWCLSNKQTLDNPRNGKDWIYVTYEDLLLNPYETLKIIFHEWSLMIPDEIEFTRQSKTSIGTFTEDKMKQLSKWKEYFDDDQIAKMLRVIEYFKIKQYSEAVLPEICL